MLKAGGDFFYDTDDRDVTRKPLLLLAGGVGINPLLSILSEIHDKRLQTDVMLLYSCKSLDECIFKVSAFLQFLRVEISMKFNSVLHDLGTSVDVEPVLDAD